MLGVGDALRFAGVDVTELAPRKERRGGILFVEICCSVQESSREVA